MPCLWLTGGLANTDSFKKKAIANTMTSVSKYWNPIIRNLLPFTMLCVLLIVQNYMGKVLIERTHWNLNNALGPARAFEDDVTPRMPDFCAIG